jgi:hypothetical protein
VTTGGGVSRDGDDDNQYQEDNPTLQSLTHSDTLTA